MLVQKQVSSVGSVKGEVDKDWNSTDDQDWKGGALSYARNYA